MWTLDVPKSSFGKILVPGVPDFAIVSQKVKVTVTSQEIGFEADIVTSLSNQPSHENQRLPLDGRETALRRTLLFPSGELMTPASMSSAQ
jgi:hypothetical protein